LKYTERRILSTAELRGLGERHGLEFTVAAQFVICREHATLTALPLADYSE